MEPIHNDDIPASQIDLFVQPPEDVHIDGEDMPGGKNSTPSSIDGDVHPTDAEGEGLSAKLILSQALPSMYPDLGG